MKEEVEKEISERWRDRWRAMMRRAEDERESEARVRGHYSDAGATQGCCVYRPPPPAPFTLFPSRPVHPTLHLRLHRACCHPSGSSVRHRGTEEPFFWPEKERDFRCSVFIKERRGLF